MRDLAAKNESFRSLLQGYQEWKDIEESIAVDDLEKVLFDVGSEANTTVPVNISDIKIDDDVEVGMRQIAVEKPEDDFDFDTESTTSVESVEESTEKIEKGEKKVKKVKKVEKKQEEDDFGDEDFGDFEEAPAPQPAKKTTKPKAKPAKVEEDDFDFDDADFE